MFVAQHDKNRKPLHGMSGTSRTRRKPVGQRFHPITTGSEPLFSKSLLTFANKCSLPSPSPSPSSSSSPIIIETPDPPTETVAKDASKAPVPVPVSPVAVTADTAARASTSERAASPDVGAASSARLRPPGKPVPRVGDDPALATNNGLATTRPPETPTTGTPNLSPNGDRHIAPAAPPQRDYGAPAQRPTATAEAGAQSIRDV